MSLIVFFYFTLVRTALREASPSRIEERLADRSRWDRLDRRLQHEDEMVVAIDILRAVATLALLLALLLHRAVVGAPAIPVALTFAAVVLLLSRIMARALARARAETVLLTNINAAFVVYRLFSPVMVLLRAVENLVFRLAGPRIQPPQEKLEEELLEVVSEGQRTGAIGQDAREMIENIIDFRDLDVGLLMTPRTDMVAIEDDRSVADAVDLILESGHARIPVFHEDRDHITGVLYERDVLDAWAHGREDLSLRGLVREAYFVPENMPVRRLLADLKERHVRLAVVLDEYGGTAGIVTFADVVEEIVGEMRDEHDLHEPGHLRVLSNHLAECGGKVRIDELNETMDLRLPENESFDTIGGLVASVSGHVPTPGEEIRLQNIRLIILDADERSVRRLTIEILDEPGSPT